MIEVVGTDRPLRRRHPAGRDGRQVRRRHLRPDRPQRRRQDDVLQRAQRVRAPGHGEVDGVRREPAEDDPLPPRPLGRAAHVPDRAGDRGAVDLRQRGDGPRALEDASTGSRRDETSRPRSSSSGSSRTRTRRWARSGAGERRLVEVARAVVGSPRVVLLDEPAAGLPDEETEHLSAVIRRSRSTPARS